MSKSRSIEWPYARPKRSGDDLMSAAFATLGADLGASELGPPTCQKCLEFTYALKVGPFPGRLIEQAGQRAGQHMRVHYITRRILSGWKDIFGIRTGSSQRRSAQKRLQRSRYHDLANECPAGLFRL